MPPAINDNGGGHFSRQIEDEDAAVTRKVANSERAAVGLCGFHADRKTEAHAAAVVSTLFEGPEQLFRFARRKAAALVSHLEQHAVGAHDGGERDLGVRASELEGVLQEVEDCGRQDRPIALDGHGSVDRGHDEHHAEVLRLQRGADCELVQKVADSDIFETVDAGVETHFGQRSVDERAQVQQAATEHLSGAATDCNAPRFDAFEREHCGVEMIAQLMGQGPQALGALLGNSTIVKARMLGDRTSDRLVERQVERAEIGCGNLRFFFNGQLGDDLANIAVVADHLAYGEAHPEERISVATGGSGDFAMLD